MDVKLPNLGEGADSGSVVKLLVKEGDQIQKGQTILELENEKAVAPIPSSGSGRVTNIRVKEGDKLSVGQVILSLSGAEEAKPAPGAAPPAADSKKKPAAKPPAKKEPDAEASGAEEKEGGGEAPESPAEGDQSPGQNDLAPAAAPSVRRLARDLGIDLRKVKGSERGGRIVLADLRGYIKQLQDAAGRERAAKPSAETKTPEPAPSIDFSQWGPVREEPMSSTRRTISRRMLDSWNSIPHVTQFATADISALGDLRKKQSAAYEARGAHLTVTVLILKAVALVLQKFPRFNSSLNESAGTLVLKNYFHLGLAVDTESGLIVPVIRDVDKKPLLELAKDVATLAERARDRKLNPAELKGGTFTISNQGPIGGGHFTPIINKPDVAILGLGKAARSPAVREEQVVSRLLLPLSLSYDHRVIDGGEAARFSVALVELLENFPEDQLAL